MAERKEIKSTINSFSFFFFLAQFKAQNYSLYKPPSPSPFLFNSPNFASPFFLKKKTVHYSLSCLINNKHGEQGLPQTARSVSWFLFCSLINCSTCNKWDSCFIFLSFLFIRLFIYFTNLLSTFYVLAGMAKSDNENPIQVQELLAQVPFFLFFLFLNYIIINLVISETRSLSKPSRSAGIHAIKFPFWLCFTCRIIFFCYFHDF